GAGRYRRGAGQHDPRPAQPAADTAPRWWPDPGEPAPTAPCGSLFEGRALRPDDPRRLAGHRRARAYPLSHDCLVEPGSTVPHWILNPCFPNAWYPACVRPAPCTSVTITAPSRTGCDCRTSIPACSSLPTGT